ncbi:TetR/AcrR family transcriptional regulator [Solwaraspora sp. WMMB335]|uniref:TetR/AcrR family transcriptional regulator n=1 Tax=Solwaraspora sp. WMMB335 TaxID=3404118 RepID=UPI003B950EBF
MSEISAAPFHVGLTPERIVDAALTLTRESHLFGWSIRDLARRLGVAPSVVYHHIGGKDLIARHVVERVLADLTAPDEDLHWQDWFRTLLYASYPIVSSYPGAAKWLLMHGPTFPSVIPIIDAGIAALQRGGFGARSGLAYTALLNNAMLTITIGDERLVHEDDGPRDHATMMDEFRKAAAGSPGAVVLAEATISPFAQGGDVAARHREEYYHYIVETTIAGLAAHHG